MRTCLLWLLLVLPVVGNEYEVQVDRVHDGDTFVCTIKMDFDIQLTRQTIRIKNFDAWEIDRTRKTVVITEEELHKGELAREALLDLFAKAKKITVHSGKRGAYGRMELAVFVDDKEVAELMKATGHDRNSGE